MDAGRRHCVSTDQRDQGGQRGRAGPHPVGEGGDIKIDALTCIRLALPVQRLMVTELAGQDHGQQVRARPAACDRMEGRRRLGDRLADAAGELLPHGLHHLPLPRDDLKGLGDGLAELGQPAAAAWTSCGTRNDHTFARQMFWQWRAYRSATQECANDTIRDRCGRILGCRRLQLLEFEFHLVEQLATALGGGAEPFVLQLGDQQLQMRHHRLGTRGTCFRLATRQLLCRKRGAQRLDVVRHRVGSSHRESDRITPHRCHARRICSKWPGYNVNLPSQAARFVVGASNRCLPAYSRAARQ